MRLDFETGIGFGRALERIRSTERRLDRIEPRLDRVELMQRAALLVALLALALALNLAPQEIAELLAGLARSYLARGG